MNISVGREEFVRLLSRAQGVVDRRHAMTVLTNVLLETGESELSLIATDLEVSLRQSCAAKIETPGSVALSARKLFEVVRESSSDTVDLNSLENLWVGISYGRSSFKLTGIDPADHPGMPKGGGDDSESLRFEIEASELTEMISKTVFAVSHDDTRSNLAGVYLDSGGEEGNLRMVATDGHRLALIDRKVSGPSIKEGVILPRKGLAELAKFLSEESGKVVLSISSAEAVVELGDCVLAMRLVEGSFPDYKQVLPKSTPNLVSIDRDELLHTVRRVSLLSSERAHGVRMALSEGRLEISANNPDLGEADEDMEVDYTGDDLEVGFNARYLLEVLAVLPEGSRVEIALGDQLSPGVLRGEDPDYSYVVMPMRI